MEGNSLWVEGFTGGSKDGGSFVSTEDVDNTIERAQLGEMEQISVQTLAY
jgi:hypothetical protein